MCTLVQLLALVNSYLPVIQARAQRLSEDMKLSVNILSAAGTSASSQPPLFYLRLFVAFKHFG